MNSRFGAIKVGFSWARIFVRPLVWNVLLAALVAVVMGRILIREMKVASRIGFTMDDAWIHAALARNLVEGNGFSINPGTPMAVSTSPAWTLLMAAFFLVYRNPVAAGLTASFLCSALSVIVACELVRRLSGSRAAGLAAGLFLLLNPISLWGISSGMEVPLVLLSVLLVFAAHYLTEPASKARRVFEPLALALAATTRPELFTIIPFALLDTWRQGAGRPGLPRRALPWNTIVLQMAILGLALLPYFLFNFSTTGHPFPTSFYAKASHRGIGLIGALQTGDRDDLLDSLFAGPQFQVLALLRLIIEQSAVLALLIPLGLLAFTRSFRERARGWFLPVSLAVLPLALGVMAPPDALANTARRYYAIFMPYTAVLGALGLAVLWKSYRQRVLAVLGAGLILGVNLIPGWKVATKKAAEDVDTIQRLYVKMGQWIDRHVEPNALLAVNDIGGVAYFGRREILDLIGLASPEMWPIILRGRDAVRDIPYMKKYLQKRGVDYLVVGAKYYPAYTRDQATFEPVAVFEEQFVSGHTWSPQVVYRCHWDKD
ncbi:MAG: hypothetical protein KKC51_11380 [Verrucomicrobia bacterium]|nr:hypothetical protein [Verrucomicrobiota bacterium]